MTNSRREVLGGLALLSACGPRTQPRGDVFAAGQPAAILVLVLAPARLLGWPRRPTPEALRLLPAAADLPTRGALTGGGAPASPEAVAALRPALILDYGDLRGSYTDVARRMGDRLGAPYRLLDGALRGTPRALIEAGRLLGTPARGVALGEAADAILSSWAKPPGTGPTFYYARGRDGLETGFAGALATEVLEGAGWRNVATGGRDIGRVSAEQVAAWDAEIVVTLEPDFARMAAANPFWRRRSGGAVRRMLLLPDLPFGWIDRPPSVNRLLGCLWLGGSGDEAATARATARVAAQLYGTAANAARTAALLPRWIS